MEIVDINDLQRLCDDKAEETTTLEFKTCSELIIGSEFRDNKRKSHRPRTRDDVIDELSKDVSALLNSNGGTIIYGIREKKSKADKLDTDNAFSAKSKDTNIFPEKIVDWIRAHILPPPFVEVTQIPIDQSNSDSPWFLMLKVKQGLTAYQARNKLFYRRVGPTVQPMEQYEVHDVMNREIVPEADVEFGFMRMKSRFDRHDYRLTVFVRNLGDRFIDNFKLHLEFPNYGDQYIRHASNLNPTHAYFGKMLFTKSVDGNLAITFRSIDRLFPKDEFDVGSLIEIDYFIDDEAYKTIIGLLPSRTPYFLTWKLFADNMQPKSGEIPFSTLHEY